MTVARVRSNLDDIPVAVRSVSSDIPPRGESSATNRRKDKKKWKTRKNVRKNLLGFES